MLCIKIKNCVALFGVLALCGCTSVFFQPTDQLLFTPEKANLAYQDHYFLSSGNTLHGWWMPAQNAKATVVFAHGNAGNVSYHLGFVHWLPKMGYNLFMFDYRGYGLSKGVSSVESISTDTVAAIEFVTTELLLGKQALIVLGHSLGGVAAARAVSQIQQPHQISTLIIDSTFANYREEAFHQVTRKWWSAWLAPFVPLVITSKSGADELISQVTPVPLWVSHGKQDQVIPYQQGVKLYDLAQQPKRFYELRTQQHNHGWQHPDDRRWLLNALEEASQYIVNK